EALGEGGIRGRPAAAAEVRALLLADLDVALDLALLLLGDERSHAGREVERVTDLDLLRALDEALDEALVHGVLDQDAGPGRTDLARVQADSEEGVGDRRVQVHVAEDDVG